MSQNYCTLKGLGWAVLISVFIILGIPIIINLLAWPGIGIWTLFNDA